MGAGNHAGQLSAVREVVRTTEVIGWDGLLLDGWLPILKGSPRPDRAHSICLIETGRTLS
jgi:hypothetical protein